MTPVPTAILRVLEGYQAAVHDRRVDAFMALYDPDARVFDTWEAWSCEGGVARRKAIFQRHPPS
jgi:hypothetical protein